MEIISNNNGSITTLSLKGRLDTVTSPDLEKAVSEAMASSETVELDFAGIVYVSSAGLRVLLQGEKAAKSAGKRMVLKNVSTDVTEVFEITGFSDILNIV